MYSIHILDQTTHKRYKYNLAGFLLLGKDELTAINFTLGIESKDQHNLMDWHQRRLNSEWNEFILNRTEEAKLPDKNEPVM